jgi:ComF family protein
MNDLIQGGSGRGRKLLMIMDKQDSVKWLSQRCRTIAQIIGIRSLFARAWPSECLLCLEPAGPGLVCDNCERLLAPTGPKCGRCAVPLATAGCCGNCVRNPPAYDDVVSAFDYRFPADRLVARFKFSADLAAGSYLGSALARAASAARPDLLVATPASTARLRERGFNPALLLAKRVGRTLGLEVDGRALAKVRHTPPQSGLDRDSRRRNLRGAFELRRSVEGMRVAVVDDVMTTGSTLAELADVLRKAGARRVSGWVVARTPEPRGWD